MRRKKEEMEEIRKKAVSLIEINPSLRIADVARHFGVCEATVSKWFNGAGLKKWF